MNIILPSEQAVIQESMQILNQTMTPSQMIVLISRWWSDSGNYLNQRDQLFAHETVESLAQKIQAFEQTHHFQSEHPDLS
jgi:hypothetical protein